MGAPHTAQEDHVTWQGLRNRKPSQATWGLRSKAGPGIQVLRCPPVSAQLRTGGLTNAVPPMGCQHVKVYNAHSGKQCTLERFPLKNEKPCYLERARFINQSMERLIPL